MHTLKPLGVIEYKRTRYWLRLLLVMLRYVRLLQCGVISAANDRLITADVTENYEVDCFDFKVDVEYHPKEDTQRFDGKITCWIDIKVNSSVIPYYMPVMQIEARNAYAYIQHIKLLAYLSGKEKPQDLRNYAYSVTGEEICTKLRRLEARAQIGRAHV